jgi:hypothetical protein
MKIIGIQPRIKKRILFNIFLLVVPSESFLYSKILKIKGIGIGIKKLASQITKDLGKI